MAERDRVVTKDDLLHDPETGEGADTTGEGEPTPDHRVLKWVVGILGVAIVAMIALILGTIGYRAMQPDPAPARTDPSTARPAQAAMPGDVSVTPPAGMTLAEAHLGGGGDMVLLRYEAVGKPAVLQIVDRHTGAVQTVRLSPDADAP